MADTARRRFFGELLRQGARALVQCQQELTGPKREAGDGSGDDEFFDSYDSSYALTLAEEELVRESARLAGIPVEGRGSLEIAKELFKRQKEGGDGDPV